MEVLQKYRLYSWGHWKKKPSTSGKSRKQCKADMLICLFYCVASINLLIYRCNDPKPSCMTLFPVHNCCLSNSYASALENPREFDAVATKESHSDSVL